jgi:tetratricopeptide (TPR) repeat protein
LSEAYKKFKILIKEEFDNTENWLFFGKTALELGEFRDATIAYKQVLLYDPISFEAFFGLAKINYHYQNYQKALKYALKGEKIAPTYKKLLFLLSQIYKALNDEYNSIKYEKLAKDAQKETSKEEKFFDDKKKPQTIIKSLKSPKKPISVEEAQNKIYEHINRLISTNEFNEAEKSINELLKEDSTNPQVNELYSDLLLKRKMYGQVISYIESLSEENHITTKMTVNLGIAYRKINNLEKSLILLQQVISIEEDNQTAWLELSNTYRKVGNNEEADKALNRATSLVTAKMSASALLRK